jgi:hypothetical protein
MNNLSRTFAPQILIGLMGGLALTLLFLWLAIAGSAVPPAPHNVPVAVVGPGPAVTRLAAGLQRGGFHVIAVPTEVQAVELVQTRNADAIVDLDTSQLQTAQAASPTAARVLPQALAALHLRVTDIKPLAPGDPIGLGLMFISLASTVGGISSGVALALMLKNRRPASLADAGSRTLLLTVFCGIQALIIAAVADAVLGYGGTQMLTVWAFSTLLSVAAMAVTVASVAALGLFGVLVSAVPIMFFGVPASPLPGPWNWQPAVFRVLGPFGPFGAATNGDINGIFFPQASQAQNLWVLLGLWIGVPVLLLLGLGWQSQRVGGLSAGRPGVVGTVAEAEAEAEAEGRLLRRGTVGGRGRLPAS